MEKIIFKNNKGEIHYGVNPSKGFISANKLDIKKALLKLGKKKLWRCIVCNDLHIGIKPPKECPTCAAIDAYVEINEQEFKTLIGI